MNGFAEIHSHFLYKIDDGAHSKEEMERMLDKAHADGISSMFATPHTTPGVQPFNNELFQRRLAEAKGYCEEKKYNIKVFPGAEILYTPMMNQHDIRNKLPTLGGSSWILVEFVPDVAFDELETAVEKFELSGYSVVIAHIERYSCMYSKNIYRLKDNHPVRYQVNSSTVLNKQGFFKDIVIRRWFKDHLIDHVSSDAHNDKNRQIMIAEAYSVLEKEYGVKYARKLCGCTDANSLINLIVDNYIKADSLRQ